MPIEIDPSHLKDDSQLELMDTLLNAADDESLKLKKIRKQISAGKVIKDPHFIGEAVNLTRGLRKAHGKWWVVEERITTGSDLLSTEIKSLHYFYEKDNGGHYQLKEAQIEQIVKVMQPKKGGESGKSWDEIRALAYHEYDNLELYDTNAEIIIDRNKKKVYLLETKAQGVSLLNYLRNNPDLDFDDRLKLVKLVINEIKKLHKIGVYHLNLNLNNIYFDENSKKITLIDFGSSQKYDPKTKMIATHYVERKGRSNLKREKEEKSVNSLADVPRVLHETNIYFDPADHDQNTPQQIDNYSLAGVFGCILSDWSEISVISNWNQLPLFSIKNRRMAMQLAGATNLDKKRYDFSYLKEIDNKTIESLANELEHLGKEEYAERGDLESFEKVIKPFLQESYSFFEETDQVLSDLADEFNNPMEENKKIILSDTNSSTTATEDYIVREIEDEITEIERLNKLKQFEKQLDPVEFPLDSEKESEQLKQLEEEDSKKKQDIAKAMDDHAHDFESEDKATLLKALDVYKRRIESYRTSEEDNTIKFSHGFWVAKKSRGGNRKANYELAKKLYEELENSDKLNKIIANIFSEDNVETLRPKPEEDDRGINSKALNDIIEAARHPEDREKMKELAKYSKKLDAKLKKDAKKAEAKLQKAGEKLRNKK